MFDRLRLTRAPHAATTVAVWLAVALVSFALSACKTTPGGGAGGDTFDIDFDIGSELPDGGGVDVVGDAVDATSDTGTPDTGDATDTSDTDVEPGCDESQIGEACGTCGALECVNDALVCTGDLPNVCGGCGVLDAAPGEDCDVDGLPGLTVCDGEDAVICDPDALCPCGADSCELAGYPGTSCGTCGDGRWICSDSDAVACQGAIGVNACGGCGTLPGSEGEECGSCGDGLWACDGTEMVCVGDDPVGNACGGCGELTEAPGDACTDECGAGAFTCSEDGESIGCVGPDTCNPCGGDGPLNSGGQPGGACSECGEWLCIDDLNTECSNARGTNECGGCALLPGFPGADCGCGGRWECDGENGLECIGGGAANACGGCTDIASIGRPLGAFCGECGVIECAGPESTECSDFGVTECGGCFLLPDNFEQGEPCGCGGTWICGGGIGECTLDGELLNDCGGCESLADFPGDGCGQCGVVTCAGTEATVCDDSGVNVCGGCEPIEGEAFPGEACGDCQVWACDPDNNGLSCVSDGANACGTCEPLAAAPGFPCGECGVFTCTEDGLSVFCDEESFNACGGCGDLDGEPGDTCVRSCGDGQYVCDALTGQTSCDAPLNNACGGCSEIPENEFPNLECDNCGEFVCNGFEDTICIPGTVNSCGGCVTSELVEAEPCTVCDETGVVLCDDELNPVCSVDGAGNVCGGCDELEETPGDACGICGTVVCTGANASRCIDPCNI
jgi:predicted small secreted protein